MPFGVDAAQDAQDVVLAAGDPDFVTGSLEEAADVLRGNQQIEHRLLLGTLKALLLNPLA
jgi:hypothetical protein